MTDSEKKFIAAANLALSTIGFEHQIKSHYIKLKYKTHIAQAILDFAGKHTECSTEVMCQVAQSFIIENYLLRSTLNKLMTELQKAMPEDHDVHKYEMRRMRKSTPAVSTDDETTTQEFHGQEEVAETIEVEEVNLRKKIMKLLIENDHYNFNFNVDSNKLEIHF
jgi:hypothetical protein